MKKIAVLFLIVAVFGMSVVILQDPAWAAQPEKLYVCGPCSSFFIEEARAVVEEMGISDQVTVKRSSCLGECGVPPVIGFRGDVYFEMTAEKLKNMLESELLSD